MGIWDWLKKKPEQPEKVPAEIVVDLPELDKEALLEETKSVFELDNEDVKEIVLVDATPEYDTGDVEIDDLLNDEMSSNYELNTVDEAEYDDLLLDAEIIGDLPSEVTFES
tara:strand:+ start:278 stop:610 length:333 start_codon:yes stop_codon:yes gene_type:complete